MGVVYKSKPCNEVLNVFVSLRKRESVSFSEM